MVLFPIALIWVGVVLYFAIVRRGSGDPGHTDDPPRRVRRPPAAPSERGSPGHSRTVRARERSRSD